jgi:bifunctional DNase/RNase
LPAGYVEVQAEQIVPLGEQVALLLVDEPDNLALPVFIGGTEGASIDTRMRHEAPPRPLTHDLMDHVMERLHAQLVQVQVDELRRDGDGGVYIGSIFVRAEGRVFHLDARPSDAVALAIGNHVPIYVKRAVLDEAGYKWDELKRQLQQAAGDAT